MPSTSYTYESLKTALQDWAEDSFADYTAQLDDIIGKAETRCYRDLALEIFDVTDESKLTTASSGVLELPSNTIVLRTVWVNGSLLQPRSESYVHYIQDLESAALPRCFAQHSETEAILGPIPDAQYSTRQRVTKRPAGLSSGNPTTFLSTRAGDLLFLAAMIETEQFDKAPEDMAIFEARYQAMLPQVRNEMSMAMRKDYA